MKYLYHENNRAYGKIRQHSTPEIKCQDHIQHDSSQHLIQGMLLFSIQ